MKLVFFLRDITDCGGIQQTTCNLVNSLVETHDIKTISLYHKNQSPFFPIDSRISNAALFKRKVHQRKDYFSIKKRVNDILNCLEYDFLIVQGALFSIFIQKKLWVKSNIIVCEHGYYGMGSFFGLHYFGKKKALKYAASIITLTNKDKEAYSTHNKHNTHIQCIPNAYVPLGFNPSYNQNSKSIVSCGRLDDIKQFEHAVLAAKLVFEKENDWKWFIYGEGPSGKSLCKLIKKLKLQNNVFLCGHETDKKTIYSDKALFVLTSRFEGFGMVLLEAQQFGIPLISYDVLFGPKEIIREGFNGYLVERNNIKALASTIIELIDNKKKRIELSCNALTAISHYSIETITEKWNSLFFLIKSMK